MKKYKNTKTGAIISLPCTVSGGNWVEIKEETEKPAEEKKEPKKAKKIKKD